MKLTWLLLLEIFFWTLNGSGDEVNAKNIQRSQQRQLQRPKVLRMTESDTKSECAKACEGCCLLCALCTAACLQLVKSKLISRSK